ncbi:MAG TPA: GNAT family N-acetyltransferase [Candidatus Nanopelagicaceae bacterium]|nr:GNAT family N-acetyltransferase [Candidatus Nanopelagicaceae bacterium]
MTEALSAAARATIREMWASRFGVPVAHLESVGLNYVAKENSTWVVILDLEGSQVVLAPPYAIPLLSPLGSKELLDLDSLVLALSDFSPRPYGKGRLLYAEIETRAPNSNQSIRITSGEQIDRFLLKCSEAEVEESGIGKTETRFGEFDANGDLVALAGYETWNGSVAHLGVLVDPLLRSRGIGQRVASAATSDAYSKGLIPQWLVKIENNPSFQLAARLGFNQVGCQLALEITAPASHS